MKRSEDRILTSHVGSLPRPQSLLELSNIRTGPPNTVTVEHPRLVADRIVRFAQVDTLRRVDPRIMWAKFEALVEGARIASRELWGR
jgi:methionine synthase II (cobalamin-independent)